MQSPLKIQSQYKVQSQSKMQNPLRMQSQSKMQSPLKMQSQLKMQSPLKMQSHFKMPSQMKMHSQFKMHSQMKMLGQSKMQSQMKMHSQWKLHSSMKMSPSKIRNTSPLALSDMDIEGKEETKKKKRRKGFQSKLRMDQRKKYEKSTFYLEMKSREAYIREHMKDLRKAKALVDDKPPKLKVSNVYDEDALRMVAANLKRAFTGNQEMVKTLHEVYIRPGRTDTFRRTQNRSWFSNYASRKAEAKQIEKQNVIMSKLIKNPNSKMTTVKEYAEEWKRLEALMENQSQFPLFWKVKNSKISSIVPGPPQPYFRQFVTEKSAKYMDKRPRVMFEVAIKNMGVVGKMVAMLYSDYVPLTVKNFVAFCDPKAKLSYKGNSFYFIFQNFYCLTGDVVLNRGCAGTSIYGPYFGNEDLTLKHGERGVLTMYNRTPNRNDSQFLIIFRRLQSLDDKSVVFGRIVKGLHVLDAIESVGTKKTGRPRVDIYISDCEEI